MKIKRMFERYRASFNERIQRFDRRLTWGQGFNRLKTANESIWFFGCSHVVGTGVDYDKVCSHVLEQISGIKVLNFGLCAGGPMAVRDELYKLLAKGYIPKGIIIAWPSRTNASSRFSISGMITSSLTIGFGDSAAMIPGSVMPIKRPWCIRCFD